MQTKADQTGRRRSEFNDFIRLVMDAPLDTYEKIDDYLKGRLSKEQRVAFEGQIQVDSDLAQQVQLQKLAYEIVFTKGLADLKAKMSADIASGKADSKPKWIWAWVIGLGMLGLVGSWFLFAEKTPQVAENQIQTPMDKRQEILLEKEIVLEKSTETTISENRPSSAKVFETNVDARNESPLVVKVEAEQTPLIANPVATETKNEQKLEVPVSNEKSKVDCGVKKWQFSLQATPACTNANDGSIEVIEKDHYQYAIGEGNFSTSKSFQHLKKGVYSVSVKDENGCITISLVEVYQKNCQENLELAFNPQLETWKVPIKESSRGELQIFSKNGRLAFSKQWNQGEDFEWDGKNQNGDLLARGLYSFTIQYANGETQQGTISITY